MCPFSTRCQSNFFSTYDAFTVIETLSIVIWVGKLSHATQWRGKEETAGQMGFTLSRPWIDLLPRLQWELTTRTAATDDNTRLWNCFGECISENLVVNWKRFEGDRTVGGGRFYETVCGSRNTYTRSIYPEYMRIEIENPALFPLKKHSQLFLYVIVWHW